VIFCVKQVLLPVMSLFRYRGILNFMKKHRWIPILSIVFFVSISFFVMAREPNKEAVLSAIVLRRLADVHYEPLPLDDALAARVFELYVKRLDPSKHFFLASDVALLKQYETVIDDELKYGQSTLLNVSSKILEQRIVELQDIYKEILADPFMFQEDVTVETEPKKRKYPVDKSAWRQDWSLYLRQQVLTGYLLALEALPATASAKINVSNNVVDPKIEQDARQKVEKTFGAMLDRKLKETRDEKFSAFLDTVANAFDPHTSYLAPQAKEDFDIGITGTLEGIGALLKEEDGFVKVTRIVPGSAASRQKQLQAEDTIIKVAQGDQEPVDIVGYRVQDAVRLIRGKKGTEVRLTVRRPEGQVVVIPIVRDVVVIEESYSKSAVLQTDTNESFGYIYLPSFYRDFSNPRARNASNDLRAEIQRLRKKNVKGIILDLRNNGGGALDDAVNISGLFIDYGPVVQVKDRFGKSSVKYDNDPTIQYQGPLIVMVNSYSASASEILAAALQDYGRAVIVGSGPNTYGKGTVQVVLNLDNAIAGGVEWDALRSELGSLKLTHQKYYRITGGATQFKGVVPDIVLPDLNSYLELGEQSLPYVLPWSTTSGLQYQPWADTLPLDMLRQKSEARVTKDPVFRAIVAQVAVRRVQKDAPWPLHLAQAFSLQQSRKKEADQIGDLVKETTVYQALASEDGRKMEPERQKEYDDWRKQLRKDPALLETVFIMRDLVFGGYKSHD
jgi:carboxyl-terminal processing protease